MDAACFQHNSAYAKYKDRLTRKQSDIVLRFATDPRNNGYQRGLASMVYKFFNERTKGSRINNKENLLVNSQLAIELHKPIIKKIKRRKIYSSFRDNIWGVDLAGMQLISKYNKGIRYILCVIDLFSRYAWVIPLKNKKGDSIVEGFKKILGDSVLSLIKMKPKDVTDDSFVEYFEETNEEDPKFKVGDNVRISKYKNSFAKGYTPNWSEEVFIVNKVQNTVP